MDGAAHRLLESVTHSTLHAHSFARSSTQATHVLTDLLSRYLSLLTMSCHKYAEHAGRSNLTIQDALAALGEMGTNMDELQEFCLAEGQDLARYAVHTARRVEDMREMHAALAEGLRDGRDAYLPLVFAPILDGWDDDEEFWPQEQEQEQESDMDIDMVEGEAHQDSSDLQMTQQLASQERPSLPPIRTDPYSLRPPTDPPLPLSPISNPSSPEPVRKRPRTASWRPPDHIPDFLPAFPLMESQQQPATPAVHPPGPVAGASGSDTRNIDGAPSTVPPPESLLDGPQLTGASDYHTRVPYGLSSLSTVPSWMLPTAPSPPPLPAVDHALVPHPALLATQAPNTPHPHPSLLGAYHHLLTHPPESSIPPRNSNPSRHRMAMALLAQSAIRPRFDAPDSLYGLSGTNVPRNAVIAPSYPKPLSKPVAADAKTKDGEKGKGKEAFPPQTTISLTRSERVVPIVSRQTSRLPHLSQMLLPPTVHQRVTELSHPQPLVRNPNSEKAERITYGEGIPAPWNVVPLSAPPPAKGKDGKPIPPKGGSEAKKDTEDDQDSVLTNARLFATWDCQLKDFRVPLGTNVPHGHHGKGRQGSTSVQSAHAHAGGSGPPSAGIIRLGLGGSKLPGKGA